MPLTEPPLTPTNGSTLPTTGIGMNGNSRAPMPIAPISATPRSNTPKVDGLVSIKPAVRAPTAARRAVVAISPLSFVQTSRGV